MSSNTSNLSRLEKKCLVASCCFHGFLALLLVFGSAFFTARKVDPPLQMLNVIPGRLVDEALSGGGGNPNLPRTEERIKGDTLKPVAAEAVATPVPAAPKAQPPEPKPEPPEPVRPKTTKPTKTVDDPPPKVSKQPTKEAVKPKADEPPKPRIDLSELRPISREDTEQDKRKAKAEAEAREARERERERAAAQAAARDRERKATALASALQRELNSSITGLQQGFNGGTKVDVGGPGGAAFANYKQFVQMAYENAWRLFITPELTDQDFVAQIRVTISRTGRVMASRIIKPSGSGTMDRSVQKAMDRVRSEGLPPFPEGATDAERSFMIEFNLKAKSRLG